MPKCSMRPPAASIAAGITSRRSAMAEAPNTITSSAPSRSTSSIALASAPCSCGTRRSATMRAPAGARRSSVTPSVLSITLVGKARQQRRDDADLADAVGRDPNQRRRFARDRERAHRASLPRTAKGMIFTVADHLARDHRLEGRQCREGDRLVDPVERVDRVLVDHQHAGGLGEQIGAAGEGPVDATPSPATAAAIRPPPRPRRRRQARCAPPRSRRCRRPSARRSRPCRSTCPS